MLKHCTSEQSDCRDDEKPVHTVTLDSFQISKYEISNQQYVDFMNDISANSNGTYSGIQYLDMAQNACQVDYHAGQFVSESGKENFPLIFVTWNGAKAFCEYYGGRLPTEAEWEYAARGGASTGSATATKYAGSNNIGEVAWYNTNSNGNTHQVGTKDPNELGICDMSGNVWEWCNDWYDSDYYGINPINNPQGPVSGVNKVMRGGSYGTLSSCRVASRGKNDPDLGGISIGFRVVME